MARTDVRDKRASYAPSPPGRDPALDALPPHESVVEKLARIDKALAALVSQKAADEARGQPTQAQPPPSLEDTVRVYDVREVAEILHLALSTVYWGVNNGKIPAIKVGARWLIPHVALMRMLEGAA
jgi:excisionase family DNA binding protein